MGITEGAAEAADRRRANKGTDPQDAPDEQVTETKPSYQTIVINIDPSELIELGQKAGEFVLKPQAEQAIIALLKLEKAVGDTLNLVKDAIRNAGFEKSEYFKCVAGDYIKANYQPGGAVYSFDETKIKRHNQLFFTKKVSYSLDSKAVQSYEYKHKGKLPAGVTLAKRNYSLRFNVSKELEL